MSGIDSWSKWEAALAQGQSITSILQLEVPGKINSENTDKPLEEKLKVDINGEHFKLPLQRKAFFVNSEVKSGGNLVLPSPRIPLSHLDAPCMFLPPTSNPQDKTSQTTSNTAMRF